MSEMNFHIVNCIRRQIAQNTMHTAMEYKDQHGWQKISWDALGNTMNTCSQALLALNISVQDKIALFAHNMPQWTMVDLAALQMRAVTVPIYPTNTESQTAYIVNDADVKVLFVGAQAQYDLALQLVVQCPQLEYIVALSEEIQLQPNTQSLSWHSFLALGNQADEALKTQLTQRINSANLEDLFTLIYTSGTTGTPKGVMLDYHNLAAQLQGHDQRLELTKQDVSLCFLPLSHVFERAWTFYVLYRGAKNCYLQDTNQVREALLEKQPTVMCAVPRFYEKVFSAIHEKVTRAPWHKKLLFTWAVNMGARKHQCAQQKQTASWLLTQAHRLAERLVLVKLRKALGGRIRFMPCGGAKLDETIGRFFHAIGINVKLGYGMTETTATISCWNDDVFHPSSIGQPMPGAEVKIGANNEILVRGPMVMKGYYKMPEESIQAFDEQGFLKTGDAGHIDESGYLFITDRIKELMKTSGGKYIAPQVIEGAIGKDHFIEQIAVIADTRKFVSALVVPCFDTLEAYAKEVNIKYQDRLELIKNSHIVDMLEQRINTLQIGLAKFEQVKKFKLLSRTFSMDSGELTPTQKLRRRVINEHYQHEIEEMYQESRSKKE